MVSKLGRAATDPTIYDAHHKDLSSSPLPQDEKGWVERAAQVSKILAVDAVLRDREQKIPMAEVSLLKSSGLLRILGPTKFGGGGQPWDVGYKVIREVAKGDGLVHMSLRDNVFDLTPKARSGCCWATTCSGPGQRTWLEPTSREIAGNSRS